MQAASLSCPTAGLNVFGRQGVCCLLPVGLKWPTSAAVHSLADVKFTELDQVPPAQGSGAAAPFGQ
eukprot:394789-Prymnesium_polylepis.1